MPRCALLGYFIILLCLTPDYFTLSNAGRFHSSVGARVLPLNELITVRLFLDRSVRVPMKCYYLSERMWFCGNNLHCLILSNWKYSLNKRDLILRSRVRELQSAIDILYILDSASLVVKLKPRIFQRLPPFE